jgi:hypothetical protein
MCLGPHGGPRGGGAVSYERGTPVCSIHIWDLRAIPFKSAAWHSIQKNCCAVLRRSSEEGSYSRLVDWVVSLNSRPRVIKKKTKKSAAWPATPRPPRIRSYLSLQRFHVCFQTFHSRLLSRWAALLRKWNIRVRLSFGIRVSCVGSRVSRSRWHASPKSHRHLRSYGIQSNNHNKTVYLAQTKHPPPSDHHRSLGRGLL